MFFVVLGSNQPSTAKFCSISSTNGDILRHQLGGWCSQSAARANDALPAVRPVARGLATVAIARVARPPASPRTPRPTATTPEPRLVARGPHHHTRLAQRTLAMPPNLGSAWSSDATIPTALPNTGQCLLQVWIARLPATDRGYMDAQLRRGMAQGETTLVETQQPIRRFLGCRRGHSWWGHVSTPRFRFSHKKRNPAPIAVSIRTRPFPDWRSRRCRPR
jgi:hypothetical protein